MTDSMFRFAATAIVAVGVALLGTITLRVSPEGGTPIDVETDDGEDVVSIRRE